MVNIFKSPKFWIGIGCFAGGLFATSKCARKIAVKGMSAGMQVKDNIVTGWENVKEEATDLYEEAKEEAASKADDNEDPKAATAKVKAAAAPKKAPRARKAVSKK